MLPLTDEQVERYSRQLILRGFGGKAQEKLLRGRVLVVGAGGLGSPALYYLVAAGVGTVGVVDGDDVDLTNLQRQIVHFTPDVGTPKVESAKRKLNQLNPDVTVVTHRRHLTPDNAAELVEPYDFVIDATDNFAAKFLVNDACVLAGKPFSHAGILRFDGLVMTHVPGETCYRCVFETPPPEGAVPTCSQAGVLGAVAGIVGTIQAAEAIKYLVGAGNDQLLVNRLLFVNALNVEFRSIELKRNPGCPVCGDSPSIVELEARNYQPRACADPKVES
ncbi:MAG: molybdopterin-synthase adenylyltransferase MoeB [Promethearchaeota archaeon]